ncbi:hypothetical protein B8040_21400, partial [Klebsiella pneumoniae]
KIGPDPRNFNQRVSLGRNDLLIRTFLSTSEKDQLEHITRKLLSRLDQMEEEGVLADSLR